MLNSNSGANEQLDYPTAMVYIKDVDDVTGSRLASN